MKLMSIQNVMDELSCSRSTVYNQLDSGVLKSIKIGRFRRITRESFDAMLDAAYSEAGIERESE